jgi:hypothetical protein
VLALNFRTAELYKINFAGDAFTPWHLLNLSESAWYVHPVGKTAVVSFCRSEQGNYAAVFCKREMRR